MFKVSIKYKRKSLSIAKFEKIYMDIIKFLFIFHIFFILVLNLSRLPAS